MRNFAKNWLLVALLANSCMGLVACTVSSLDYQYHLANGGGVGGDHGTTASAGGAVHGANATAGGMGHGNAGGRGSVGAASGGARR